MEIGTILLNRYEILEQIGEGGMATVYKAKCHTLDRLVAIKVLKSEYAEDEEFVKKFMMECQSAAKLNHPNIVGIYDFHEIELDGKPVYFIVMEYIDGITLKELIEKKGFIPEEEAVDIALQILEALKEAHSHGVIHRDIKPHNIMISKSGIVKVTDFGIARATSNHTMTTTMDAIGSVHYFSPEQARGAFTDQRTDIYSFGIVFYEMLTGKRPFVGENPVTIAMKHIQEDITPPGELNEDISEGVERVVLKCTMKKQAERYQNVEEIITDLKSTAGSKRTFVPSDVIDDSLDQTRVIPTAEIDKMVQKNKKVKINKNDDYYDDDDYDDDDFDDDDYYDDDDDDYYDDYDDYGKKKKLGIIPIVLGVLAAFVLTTGLYLGFTKLKQIQKDSIVQEIALPNLIGKTEAEARKAVQDMGLKFEVKSETTDSSKPYGVLSQDPQSGMSVKQNSTVYVVLNVDSKATKLDSYVGMKLEEIESKVKELGLKIEVDYVDDDSEENTILAQNPIAGSSITEGDTLYLSISNGKGAEENLVPNVLGMNFDDAKKMLEEKGLIVKDAVYVASEETEKDRVLSQSIESNQTFENGDTIELNVSKGPEEKPEENEENPEEKPNEAQLEENKPEDKPAEPEKPQVSTTKFSVAVPLPSDVAESVVKLVKVVDGNRETVYENTFSKDEEVAYINLKDQPVGEILELYINDEFAETFTVQQR
ncbi:MAG: Stk1 family PASTA domain-containing Ser/Thr kinase [Ezakiella sp.]|uniref:Stk1 family PASTA domain-containing Ser/Thr kinase n=1 Tax=Ezakiella sp. TaxID=1935205 RepID=UPI002972EDAA|nr:Stk1 family PASTA domain-containing Ser/Thr kinase [Ezakiella sp.]MDD7731375.1 Stk1 family PASTA domain-containing Ser/Thr kinase [Eubacteriales bacterium]MDY6079523.1 Stk1 family PASTA domain-containing Ser/Thr kinase [Ezakiella sp.]